MACSRISRSMLRGFCVLLRSKGIGGFGVLRRQCGCLIVPTPDRGASRRRWSCGRRRKTLRAPCSCDGWLSKLLDTALSDLRRRTLGQRGAVRPALPEVRLTRGNILQQSSRSSSAPDSSPSRAARATNAHSSGRQISVSKSAGAVSLGLFRYSSNAGASAASRPDCTSHVPYSH